MSPVEIIRGDAPIVLSFPHASTWLPDEIWEDLRGSARGLIDTDWHIDRLYEGLLPNATIVKAGFHRYLIDANRDPENRSLYPGQNTTTLVPLTDFDGQPIWSRQPDRNEINRRRKTFHAIYHDALAAELNRVKAAYGLVILFDCHSIRSLVPHLFEGELPFLNIGTNDATTCDPEIERRVTSIAEASDFSTVANGRFKGGWTTRHHGNPSRSVHAIQMEIAQRAYLDKESPPWEYSDAVASPLRATLTHILKSLETFAKECRS